MSDTHDPFYVADKAKAISWKGAPIGAKIEIKLDGPASKIQSRKYGTQELDTWDDDSPKFSAVVSGLVKGQRRSLWCQIPSNLFYVLAKAQDTAGKHFAEGGELTVTLVGTKASDNPAYNASNQFEAVYVPPTATATPGADPWSDEPPF